MDIAITTPPSDFSQSPLRWLSLRQLIISFLLISLLTTGLHAQTNGEVLETYTLPNGRKVEKVHWQETVDGYVLISYPKDFNPEQIYHINFWFPGTSGKPSQGIENENDQYLGIGLSYLQKSHTPSGQYYQAHWALCKEVEATLQNRSKLTIGARTLSGVSKGGWVAFYTSLDAPDGLDGLAIIAAGKPTQIQAKHGAKKNKLAILLCTGETDPNYPYTQLAVPYFKAAIIESLCYEEWLGKGHISKISPRVNEWLNVQAVRKSKSSHELQQHCQRLVTEKLKHIDSISSGTEQYIALRHLLGSPSTHYIDASTKARILNQGRELSQSPSLQPWLSDFKAFRKLIKEETHTFKLGNLKTHKVGSLIERYQHIAQSSPHPDIQSRAAFAYLRVLKMHAMLAMQDTAKKEPTFSHIQQQIDQLQKRQDRQINALSPTEAKQLHELHQQAATLRGKMSMDAFYNVEWHNKYTIHPAMAAIIEQHSAKETSPPHTKSSKQPYSGIAY